MILNDKIREKLLNYGFEVLGPNRQIPDETKFESPSSIKFTKLSGENFFGAYSYCVSGFICSTSIGRYCSFGENVQIGRQNHPINWLSTSPFLYRKTSFVTNAKSNSSYNLDTHPKYTNSPTNLRRVNIGNDVWIGQSAIINCGVQVNTGAIIASGSVVTKDVPPYAIVGGNPAKVIKYRFSQDIIDILLKSEWWTYPPKILTQLDVNKPEDIIESLLSLDTKDKLCLNVKDLRDCL